MSYYGRIWQVDGRVMEGVSEVGKRERTGGEILQIFIKTGVGWQKKMMKKSEKDSFFLIITIQVTNVLVVWRGK